MGKVNLRFFTPFFVTYFFRYVDVFFGDHLEKESISFVRARGETFSSLLDHGGLNCKMC